CVDRDLETTSDEKTAGGFEDAGSASRAVAITEDDIGTVLAAARGRRHRMAVYEETPAEHVLSPFDQPAQCMMVGVIEALDPLLGIGKAQFLGVDLLAAGNDAGDRAEPAAHPRRSGVDE